MSSLSVIVPLYDEEANVGPLVERTLGVLRGLRRPFELILVDDGSGDSTLARAREAAAAAPELVVIALRRNFGQTPALQAGLDRARGDVIVTLDGDLQNDPADIPKLLARIEAGADVVSGWRQQRSDTFLLRTLPSWLANRLIRLMTGVPIHDQGCSLKAYRREVIDRVRLYSDMHRFIVVLGMAEGAEIDEVVVSHHPRAAGRSKYGLSRVFKVVLDLLALETITRFRERPVRWFAALGLPFLLASVAAGLASVVFWDTTLVMPTVSIVSTLAFVWCLLAGFLAEAIRETGDAARADALYRELDAAP